MSIEPVISEALRLSVDQRIRLIQDLWDSIAEVPDAVSMTDQQLAELRLRLDEYRDDPTQGSPWSDVRARIASM